MRIVSALHAATPGLLLAACLLPAGCTATGSDATPPTDATRPAAPAPARAPYAPATPVESGARPTPEGSSAPARPALAESLELLDVALAQRAEPALWSDVAETAAAAADAFARARAAGDPDGAAAAGRATAEILADWHALYLEGLEASPDDVVAALRDRTFAARYDALVARLEAVEGAHPQTSMLLAEMLFEGARDAQAAEVLRRALPRWPEATALHRTARAWRDAIPDPEPLVAELSALTERSGPPAAEALLTRAWLQASLAGSEYSAARLEEAARLYAAAARDFGAALGQGPVMTAAEADLLTADHEALAGWSHYYIAENGTDEALRRAALERAAEHFAAALERVPAHEQAALGVQYVGDFYLDPGKLDDMAAARDFFGALARRFDVAEWWNNYAFFCRETGMYEESYAAYERCIALAPDNARWLNDTALILVYHLERDWDRAEELLVRAQDLAREVCDNPFVDDETYAQSFEALGDAMLNLSLLYLVNGELDRAAEQIDALIEVAPDRPDARDLARRIEAARASAGGGREAGTSGASGGQG